MKIVLRDRNTGQYLRRVGTWVARLEEAMTFETMTDVREYCQAHQLVNVQPIRWWMPYLGSLLRSRSTPTAS